MYCPINGLAQGTTIVAQGVAIGLISFALSGRGWCRLLTPRALPWASRLLPFQGDGLFADFFYKHQAIFYAVSSKSIEGTNNDIFHAESGKSEIVPTPQGQSECLEIMHALRARSFVGRDRVAKGYLLHTKRLEMTLHLA